MSIRETQVIERQLLEYLSEHADVCEDIDAGADLIEHGVLDSLLVTDLVLFVRTQFGIELTPRDISPENLGSIRRMASLVRAKQEKLRRAA